MTWTCRHLCYHDRVQCQPTLRVTRLGCPRPGNPLLATLDALEFAIEHVAQSLILSAVRCFASVSSVVVSWILSVVVCFTQFQDTTGALPCHIHLPVCLWIMDPHSRAQKKNTSHGNEVLPQDTTHLIQRPCYQRGSPRQDPAGNWTTRRPPDHHKETQTAVLWSCLSFIRSGQNSLARHSEWEKKTRQTKEEVGRRHQEMDRPGVRQVPEGNGEQGKMEETGYKIICGAPTTLAVKG